MSFVIVNNKIKTVKINNKSSAVSYVCEKVELGGKK
jgi:hypothetical protein